MWLILTATLAGGILGLTLAVLALTGYLIDRWTQ